MTLQPFAKVDGGALAIAAPDDGTGRLFVVAQDGRIWVVKADGTTLSEPLVDLRSSIKSGGEQGLLGLALHPGFPTDPHLYVDFTNPDGDTVVASLTVDPADPNRADPATLKQLLFQKQPFANHNGGALAFGPDGDLYVSLGDGGSGGDPQGNGQNTNSLLGKILRLDVDNAAGGHDYAIPAGNPFAASGGAPEIWLYGLRNPWRMSFDRATGDLWIGDVGQNSFEEVDVARAGVGGLNFGWNRMEATHCYDTLFCSQDGLTPPVSEYGRERRLDGHRRLRLSRVGVPRRQRLLPLRGLRFRLDLRHRRRDDPARGAGRGRERRAPARSRRSGRTPPGSSTSRRSTAAISRVVIAGS